MTESKFQEYYQQIKDRDEMIAAEQPLPKADGVDVYIVFGLSLGIASIVFGFFTKYSIILALLALILSFIGYRHKRNINVSIAGLICSCTGLFLATALAIYRYAVITSVDEALHNILHNLLSNLLHNILR